jgi:RecA-family ATPase
MEPEFNDTVFKQGLTTSEVTDHVLSKAKEIKEKKGLFLIKETNIWVNGAKKRPIPNMLFSEFWYEGELCILFADTGLGKSILAVQIANSIASGQPIPGFKLNAEKQKVLYFDFELSDKQFENRYSENYKNHYIFPEIFLRAEIDPEADFVEGKFEEYLFSSLEDSIKDTQCKVLIIDNITYLKNETEKAKDALPLMKLLQALTKKYNISILALAHTPKRDATKPINRNDLSGSKMLINFCDSSFTIGESQQEPHARYLKQIKARATEMVFDSGNVMLCQLSRPVNFLMFEFITHTTENAHLKTLGSNQQEELVFKAKELQKEGKSQREISSQLEIALGTVNKYLKK